MGNDWQHGTSRGSSDRAHWQRDSSRASSFLLSLVPKRGKDAWLREPRGALESLAAADLTLTCTLQYVRRMSSVHPWALMDHNLLGKKTGKNLSQIPSL